MQAIPKAVPKDFDTSCVTASADGVCFSLLQAEEARAYFSYHGFVVVRDVTSEEENARAMAALLHDIHEVNPAVSAVTDLSQFAEHDLPTSPNNAFRATCNMAFGRFASAVRLAPGIRKAFATIHQTDALACSWDIPFYTPQPDRVPSGKALQLHWDHNWYYGGTQAPLADALCAQGVYYATATDPSTPSFVCVPRSHTVWRTFCESDLNPAKRGAPILSYLPLTHFDEQFLCDSGLGAPVRVHVPARSLLLWDSRTCHGNSPPCEPAGSAFGRVAFAVCYGPVAERSIETHKRALIKGFAGIHTTHHPGFMLAHDKHGYPEGFVSIDEPNKKLRKIKVPLHPHVQEPQFQEMIARAALTPDEKRTMAATTSLQTLQQRAYNSYNRLEGLTEEDCYSKLLQFEVRDLRALLHPDFAEAQAIHSAEL